MPIKFPKFSRRKSAGNALEAGYEPANQGVQVQLSAPEPQEHHNHHSNNTNPTTVTKSSTFGGAGYGGPQQRQNRGSGNTSGSGYSNTDYASTGSINRLSSSSTLPSPADAPRTPASTDDHHAGAYTHNSATKSTKSNITTTSSTGSSTQKRSGGGIYGPPSPRRENMTSTPPKLETTLDTGSLFGEDMFSFSVSKGSGVPPATGGGIGAIPHTAPKLASTRIINTSDNHNDISPVPPPKTYDPIGTSPTNQRFSYAAYSNIYASPTHMDSDRPATSESPYGWGTGGAEDLPAPPTMPAAKNSNSPRNSRNLTPGQNIQPAPSHSHSDSLSAPSRQTKPGRQQAQRDDSSESLGVKRNTNMRRPSYPEDEPTPKGNVQQQKQQIDRRAAQSALPSALQIGGAAKGLSDRMKGRDSGWEESVASGSSSVNSYPGNSSSGSSHHDTRGTSPAMSRVNTDPIYNLQDNGPKARSTAPAPALKPIQLTDGDDMDFDESISASASLAARYENLEQAKPTNAPNKVMTPAQFERYRQEQDNQRRLSGKSFTESDNESGSESEEESETEKHKEALKQRQKQEAHLSVYRQQMMKITGSQPMEQPYNARGSISASTLPLPMNNSMPQLSLSGPGSSGRSSEEEDEEIPLGILMAHGFPSRSRPPTRLSNASSQPNLRQSAMIQDSRLPPFARNLPADPYNLGASIINPTNRMSLAFGVGGDQRSVAGGSVYGGDMPARRQPGGLIGEIMRTEEMKAARKGGSQQQFIPQKDPFNADPFDRHPSPGGGMLGLGGGALPGQYGGGMGMGQHMPGNMSPRLGPSMGMPGMPPMQMPTAAQGTDPMQMQMANQMQQMMQMQMQWMQMQMQMQNPQQAQPMLSPPVMGQRPMSMAGPGAGNFSAMPQPHQRTMSMMEPLPMFQGPGYAPSIAPSQRGGGGGGGGGLMPPGGYTPSIAPSERSTVGLPSRYRPVSYMAPVGGSQPGARTSSLISGISPDMSKKGAGPSHLKNSGAASDDEDDESGWEALERKRQEKKEGWKKKRETGLKGILNFGSSSGPSDSK